MIFYNFIFPENPFQLPALEFGKEVIRRDVVILKTTNKYSSIYREKEKIPRYKNGYFLNIEDKYYFLIKSPLFLIEIDKTCAFMEDTNIRLQNIVAIKNVFLMELYLGNKNIIFVQKNYLSKANSKIRKKVVRVFNPQKTKETVFYSDDILNFFTGFKPLAPLQGYRLETKIASAVSILEKIFNVTKPTVPVLDIPPLEDIQTNDAETEELYLELLNYEQH